MIWCGFEDGTKVGVLPEKYLRGIDRVGKPKTGVVAKMDRQEAIIYLRNILRIGRCNEHGRPVRSYCCDYTIGERGDRARYRLGQGVHISMAQ